MYSNSDEEKYYTRRDHDYENEYPDSWGRWMVMAMIVLTLMLGGCATPDFMFNWYRSHEPLPRTWHVVPQSAVQAYCGRSDHLLACAYWIEGDHCWIFTSQKNPTPYVIAHEERHCDGWSHD